VEENAFVAKTNVLFWTYSTAKVVRESPALLFLVWILWNGLQCPKTLEQQALEIILFGTKRDRIHSVVFSNGYNTNVSQTTSRPNDRQTRLKKKDARLNAREIPHIELASKPWHAPRVRIQGSGVYKSSKLLIRNRQIQLCIRNSFGPTVWIANVRWWINTWWVDILAFRYI
jgi:hypothetical protein